MPYDDCLPTLDIERIRNACIEKVLAEPEQAGVYRSPKSGRVPLADWRSWLFCHAADRSATILAFEAVPLVVDVLFGSNNIPFPIDFRIETRSGIHLVAFDMPELEPWEHALLLSTAARHCPNRLVRVTDTELDFYAERSRMPDPADIGDPVRRPDCNPPPSHR